MRLTGKFQFRKTLRGKIVLQVEEDVKPLWSTTGALKRRWRDGKLMDLAAPEMRSLIDMRFKPQPSPRGGSGTQDGSAPMQREVHGEFGVAPSAGDLEVRRTQH